jgi:hypothetical protein
MRPRVLGTPHGPCRTRCRRCFSARRPLACADLAFAGGLLGRLRVASARCPIMPRSVPGRGLCKDEETCATPAFANGGELLVVPDAGNHCVVAFHTTNGSVAWIIGGGRGGDDSQLNFPQAVFVQPGGTAGLLVVVDTHAVDVDEGEDISPFQAHRLQWFDLVTQTHVRTVDRPVPTDAASAGEGGGRGDPGSQAAEGGGHGRYQGAGARARVAAGGSGRAVRGHAPGATRSELPAPSRAGTKGDFNYFMSVEEAQTAVARPTWLGDRFHAARHPACSLYSR